MCRVVQGMPLAGSRVDAGMGPEDEDEDFMMAAHTHQQLADAQVGAGAGGAQCITCTNM